MHKRTYTYNDFNGVERTEDCYFNLSKSELVEWELGVEGGLTALLDKIVKTKNSPELVKLFKSFILKAYGEKSADGRRFVKSEEISIAFSQTPMYDELFMELATSDEKAIEFIKALVPDEKVAEEAAKKVLATAN